MADLNYDEVRKILAILDASTLDEVHVEIGDFKLDVRRHTGGVPSRSPIAEESLPAQSKPAPAPAPAPVKAPPSVVLAPGQFALKAPMLGTLYRAPAPDAPPFIQVGTVVSADDTLCIIEVMKLMNTIKAEKAGRVAAIVAENGTLVEFGQTLIVFDPV